MHRRDRTELSLLSLGVLGWALVVAPLVHTVEHSHGHQHSHAAGNFEHHQALLSSPPAMPDVRVVLLASRVEEVHSPNAPYIERQRMSEEPQGP